MSSNQKLNLKELGLKATQARIETLQVLEKNKHAHLSADDIFHMLRSNGNNASLATVYRVLGQFESAGIVTKLKLDNDLSMYELSDGEHHDHIICVECGNIEEFYNKELEDIQSSIVESMGAEMVDHSLNIYVTCANCRNKNNKE